MISNTAYYAFLLVLLGVGTFLASEHHSPTALIPAFFGLIFLVLSFIAKRDNLRPHAMHGAALLCLLLMIGTIGGLFKFPNLIAAIIQGQELPNRPLAIFSQSAAFILSLAYMTFSVRSFIAARRARLGQQGS